MNTHGEGVTDEQRVAAFRDRYGRVAYRADNRRVLTWGEASPEMRVRYGRIAEAVINAFLTGRVEQEQASAPGAATAEGEEAGESSHE